MTARQKTVAGALVLCMAASLLLAQEESEQPPEEDTYDSGYFAGRRAGAGTGNKNWFASGLFLGPVGVILPWVFGPKVPGGNLIGKSPDYVEGYAKGYKEIAGQENFLYSLKGCGIFAGVAATIGAVYYINENSEELSQQCLSSLIPDECANLSCWRWPTGP